MNSRATSTAVTITIAALFSALAFLTVFILRIPFIPAVGFLKYEAKDAVLALEALFEPRLEFRDTRCKDTFFLALDARRTCKFHLSSIPTVHVV